MKIILPLSVIIPRKTKNDKVFILNLNVYRNSHHMTLNQAKVLWKNIVGEAIKNQPSMILCSPLHFIYTVFSNSNRKFDLANVLSIIQKFTDDALIEYAVIQDDSYKIIPKITYCFGGVDKENPRCELEIQEIQVV